MPFELQVALRYLLAKRRQVFISVISLVSTIGVTVGVAALIIAMALMTGLQGELQNKILGSSAHVFVFKPATGIEDYRAEVARIRGIAGVTGAAPAVMGKAMISGGIGQPGFVAVKGVDPELEPSVTDVAGALNDGKLTDLVPAAEDDLPGIVLGKDLAGQIGAMLGDTVTLTTPNGSLTPMGVMPRMRRFKIVGTFRLGLYDVDSTTGLVALEPGLRLAGVDRVDHIEVKIADIYDAPRIADEIALEFGSDYVTQDWTDINQQLYSALWLEKVAISMAIGLIVMVAALNIVASLVLLVMEKTRDIGILRTMGATSGVIRRIFILQGLTIGLIGTTAGTVLGLIVCFVMDRWKLIKMPDVYQITYLPFRVELMDVVTVVVFAMVICLVATIYPSRQAARIDPAEALRHQ